MHGEVEVIAGHRHAHVGHIGFVSATNPSFSQNSRMGSNSADGQAVLREVAAQRALAAIAVAGEMRGRFLHAHRLAGRIEKSEFVERIFADALPRDLDAELFDAVHVLRDAGLHVGDGGRRKLELVQPDVQPPVGHDAVRMRPGVGGAALAEPESFVEGDRIGDVRRLDADFVKLS